MKPGYQDPDLIREIINNCHTIAVVGLSDKPERPSFGVASYLQSQGYRIIPVNPSISIVLGEKSYPDLLSIHEKIDIVDIFRKSEDVGQIIEQAIEIKPKFIWMQEGVINESAARMAVENGIPVIMDRCLKKEHEKLFF